MYTRTGFRSAALVCAALLLAACGSDGDGSADGTDDPGGSTDGPVWSDPPVDEGPEAEALIREAEVDLETTLPGLQAPVHVFRTEGSVPHIYAESHRDLAYAMGYVVALDRYFLLDLGRRLGLGTISELLGDDSLANDMESRGIGQRFVAEQILENLNSEQREVFEAFAEGINAYIARAQAGEVPQPSEFDLAGTLLGTTDPNELMTDFTALDIAGFTAVVVYNLGYETGDVGRGRNYQNTLQQIPELPFGDLRLAGAIEDVWHSFSPVHYHPSAPAWETVRGDGTAPSTDDAKARAGRVGDRVPPPLPFTLPESMMERAEERFARLQVRLRRDQESGFGSNSWAVTGSASTTGESLLAGDGHLSLAVPSLFYQIGLNTRTLGGGEIHQSGLVFPGFPYLAVGTNGHVSWCQTQLSGDITDWYREEIRLDANGVPEATRFQGEWRPLTRIEETYVIRDVPLLGSRGRTETWARWVTFDGRWLADIEGRTASPGEEVGEGESVVAMQGSFVVPGDTDEDGVVTGLSFAYAGFQMGNMIAAVEGFGLARDVEEFRDATRSLVAYSQNIVAADRHGDVLYTGYQAVPCRGYLPRDEDGEWLPGADPNRVLDGTQYGAFQIPTLADGRVDESHRDDPYRCVVPFDEYPQVISPASGFVQTANNDPGPITGDDSITDGPWYIGGPWDPGFRADTIVRELTAAIEADAADLDRMAEIQGATDSRLGELFLPHLLESLENGLAASESSGVPHEARMAAIVSEDREAFEEVRDRLATWLERGRATDSGVVTFYNPRVSGEQRENAVATMVFNTWFKQWNMLVLDDEPMGGLYRYGGNRGRTVLLWRMLEGRGPDNPEGLASWNPETGESIFFDRADTEVVEHSDEIAVMALARALAFLRGPSRQATAGFNNNNMSSWLWGLRHVVRFESLLADFLGNDPTFEAFIRPFNITTGVLPLVDEFSPGTDPRRALTWFPRPGDQFAVDAANPGLTGERFSYGSGPVMRMVIALAPNGRVTGRNVIPGGQSALTDSPHFADQAALWLGNETLPMHFHVEDVVTHAEHHEVLVP